ncbi:MAG: ribosomal RNA small subunit methyltransferase A [Opitutus sp.]|nr:ribosomal RNA small subunit methyltransferase A [Opitutus sp.]
MPLTLTGTRELLARLGHSPKRFLGQNYLIDGNIVRKSVELGGVQPGEAVVEVGPGLGTLTSALLAAGAEVWAVEKDATMAAHLRATLAAEHPGKLHLIEEDAVEHPIADVPAERAASFKIVANLPYAISTPWMDAVLGGPLPTRMVLMLQQEAAQRYVASHGTKQFGAISIFVQSAFLTDRGHKVPASCFYPAPEVESYLLNLVRRPEPFIFPTATKQLIRGVFQQRRKQIASLLRDRLPDGGRAWLELFSAAGLDGRARPEEIPVALWQRLVV